LSSDTAIPSVRVCGAAAHDNCVGSNVAGAAEAVKMGDSNKLPKIARPTKRPRPRDRISQFAPDKNKLRIRLAPFWSSVAFGFRPAVSVGSISSALTSMLTSTVHSSLWKPGDAPSVPLPDEWLDLSPIPDVS
jgi:hypothetical protein